MATPSAREPKKFVTKSSGIGKTFTKEPAKSVAKKPKKSDDKKNVTKKTVAKKPDRSVESNGWKKPASKRNLDPSGSMLRSKCHFFKLPLEIRFMIYSDLIKSQKMAFLVTCQRIYNEALAVVYRDAIFIVTESREPYLPPWIYGGRDAAQREPISDKIQNLEIHTALELFIYRGEKYEVIDYFGAHYPELQDLNISRRKCWIDLNTHCRLLWEPHMEERLVTMLRALRGFDTTMDAPRPILKAEFESRVESLGKGLERVFGPAKWEEDPDKLIQRWNFHQRWEFHPRQERQRGSWEVPTGERNEGPE